jgi:hypothetical protein
LSASRRRNSQARDNCLMLLFGQFVAKLHLVLPPFLELSILFTTLLLLFRKEKRAKLRISNRRHALLS